MGLVLSILVMMALMIPVAMAIWLAPALVVLSDRGAVEAMKESFAGCLKNIVPFLLYGVVLFVASIVAAIPLFLGWLVLGPVFAGSIYASTGTSTSRRKAAGPPTARRGRRAGPPRPCRAPRDKPAAHSR